MTSVVVKNFQASNLESKNLTITDNISDVSQLKQVIGESFKLNPKHFDIIRRGHYLKEEQSLESLKLNEGDTLYVLKANRKVEHITESVDEDTMKHVVTSMKQLLSKSTTRVLLERKMRNRDFLECVIEAVPAFGEDSIAMDVLSNVPLLIPLFCKKASQPEKFLDDHRSMLHACLILIEEVKGDKDSISTSEAAKLESKALFSLDSMSHQEEEEEEEMDTDDDEVQTQRQNLLRSFLRPFGLPVSNATATTTSTTTTTNTITPDFFRQAINAISNNINLPPTPNNNAQPSNLSITQEQLTQMRELGVADESAARTLLNQTNGNVEAAIALFYESQDLMD